MFLSLCFLLTLASCGFSGVQAWGTVNYPRPSNPPYFTGFVDPYKGGNSNNAVSNKVQQPSVTFLSGGIFGFMGMLPMPKPDEQSSDDENESFRADKAEKMKELDEKLKSTLKALDDLEEDVKARKSTRFMQYD